MALQLGALRAALIEAGSSDEGFVQLRAEMLDGFFRGETALAAMRTDLKGDLAELRSGINLLKRGVGTSVAGTIAVLLHTFLR